MSDGTREDPPLPSGPWCWRKIGAGYYLSTERGGGLFVLGLVEVNRRWDGDAPAETVLAVRDADGVLVPLTPGHPVARALVAVPEMLAACRAALAYDRAVRSCDDDPARMASFRTAEGDTLDTLYLDWQRLARQALGEAGGGE